MKKNWLLVMSWGLGVLGLLILNVVPVFAQEEIPYCDNLDELELNKVVPNVGQCDIGDCYLPTVGEAFFCNKPKDGNPPQEFSGVKVCSNPDPMQYDAFSGGVCQEGGDEPCYIGSLQVNFCAPAIEEDESEGILEALENAAHLNIPESSGAALEAKPPGPASVGLGGGPAGLKQLQEILTRVINISVALAFIALTVVLVYAGIKYITSGGEQKALAQAHQAVTWALMGILFLAIAWLVLKLIAVFTGVDVTQFCLGFAGASTGCT